MGCRLNRVDKRDKSQGPMPANPNSVLLCSATLRSTQTSSSLSCVQDKTIQTQRGTLFSLFRFAFSSGRWILPIVNPCFDVYGIDSNNGSTAVTLILIASAWYGVKCWIFLLLLNAVYDSIVVFPATMDLLCLIPDLLF